MTRHSRTRLIDIADSLTVAILALALFAGKVKGVVTSPVNLIVAAGFLAAAALLLLADFHLLRGWWAWSGWLLLVIVLAAFAVVNL